MAEPAVQTFGKYQILECIATGGMAEIYKARLEGIGGFQRTFAIKRVLPHLSQNADYVAMLVDEAKIAGLLSHANIVQILDLGQVDKIWYIAMEYVNGRDLGAVLDRCAERGLVLPVPHAAFVAIELLKGLDYAHKRTVMRGGRQVPLNVIHRDVSPPNILIAFQGEVKLTDFGIARASLKVMETQAGMIRGRFDFMSPEQASGSRDLDQRSDLFSVGVVLYQMLSGTHPFSTDNELDTLDAVREGRYVRLRERNPDVPAVLEAIVDRALRPNRDERFMTAEAFKEALDRFFQDSGFLFTQDTLGSYVRELFPESTRRGASGLQTPFAPDPPTEEVDLFDDADEGPTRVMDSALLQHLIPPAPVAKPAQAEEETVIRPNLLADAREAALRVDDFPLIGDDGAEAETLVARMPSTTQSSRSSKTKGPTVRTVLKRADALPLPMPAPAPPRVRHGVPGAVALLVALGLGFFGLVAGVAFGAGGMMLAQHPAVASARVEVSAPAGALIEVNGVPVAGGVSVGPNQPQQVRVSLGEQQWTGTVSVGPGQTRIVVVQGEQLSTGVP